MLDIHASYCSYTCPHKVSFARLSQSPQSPGETDLRGEEWDGSRLLFDHKEEIHSTAITFILLVVKGF